MSNSIKRVQGGEPGEGSSAPRALIHKKILEAAEARPDASFAELADEVSGASEGLVERVLEEYGDPAEGEQEGSGQTDTDDHQVDAATSAAQPGDTMSTTDTGQTDLEQVTERQERVLRAIYERPNATQAEIAEEFDVSAATISQRVNAIDGFDWARRQEVVRSLFENGDEPPSEDTAEPRAAESDSTSDDVESRSEDSESDPDDPEPPADADSTDDTPRSRTDGQRHESGGISSQTASQSTGEQALADLTERVDDLATRIAALEERVDDRSAGEDPFTDPDLVSKMVHACMESDRVTDEEELRILRGVLATPEPVD